MSWIDINVKEKEDSGRYDIAQDFTINDVEGI
jgi:hypothetical protein